MKNRGTTRRCTVKVVVSTTNFRTKEGLVLRVEDVSDFGYNTSFMHDTLRRQLCCSSFNDFWTLGLKRNVLGVGAFMF